MSGQVHRSDPRILNRRTLERDHRRLAGRLADGMVVLDVGCGSGAITAGIARRVGPSGYVVGVDRDASLLGLARQEHHDLPNVSFELEDAALLPFEDRFDVVTAARTLQWVDSPERVLMQMKKAAKVGGLIFVLDYNHQDSTWEPDPPAEFVRFYSALLQWRTANNWDNRIADHLPEMLRSTGLVDVRTCLDDEITVRGDAEFTTAAAIWPYVIDSVGPQLAASGFLAEEEQSRAAESYSEYLRTGLQRQTLSMRTVEGTKR
ncbi:MAG: methyltransferase domain-containing protein [Acidobacteriaceae bacterium]|nr:methyltransferase domain-containing protein [Acidobacteriaceae bacterium]